MTGHQSQDSWQQGAGLSWTSAPLRECGGAPAGQKQRQTLEPKLRRGCKACCWGVPGGIHVCMWGKVDTGHNNAVDMTLGLPSRALRRMGIKHVEESRMLTFHVGGTAHNPDIDIVQCAPVPPCLCPPPQTGSLEPETVCSMPGLRKGGSLHVGSPDARMNGVSKCWRPAWRWA